MALTERNYLRFYSRSGNQYRISIKQEGYSGGSTLVTGADSPFITELTGDTAEVFEPIKPSKLQLNLIATTATEFLSYYTSQDKNIRVDITRNGAPFGSYWILADQYEADYLAPPKSVSFDCTDGLVFLEKEKLSGTGRSTELELIAEILQATGLDLDIWISDQVFEDSMSSANSDTPQAQTYVNRENFTKDDGEYYTYKEVLEAILEPKGLQIRQSSGHWSIFRPAERTETHRIVKYDSTGAYLSN